MQTLKNTFKNTDSACAFSNGKTKDVKAGDSCFVYLLYTTDFSYISWFTTYPKMCPQCRNFLITCQSFTSEFSALLAVFNLGINSKFFLWFLLYAALLILITLYKTILSSFVSVDSFGHLHLLQPPINLTLISFLQFS